MYKHNPEQNKTIRFILHVSYCKLKKKPDDMFNGCLRFWLFMIVMIDVSKFVLVLWTDASTKI